eukprot:Gregarina_sp_Poly_1__332@NODE_107_length_14129_cov_139_662779_g94_i0_p5_GENE_NODE_107_length_14129_cov_139_662779_g94_i0NODE_107_length_14129_cov_139_662779_g94_i0_p5_ORF_typecomplete_len376_score44_89Methyltr_RsmBF/PF01189_17/8_9e43PCMT/PF01135_19/0_0025PCMT/PF01135_19/7_1e03Methyltrans_SAM/PF10672_9/0_0073FtsJ/PF01728_19/0_081RrnaAD/PF00398_20/0_082_NODE_107_length_14129_cov_139_662779_g94_i081529279
MVVKGLSFVPHNAGQGGVDKDLIFAWNATLNSMLKKKFSMVQQGVVGLEAWRRDMQLQYGLRWLGIEAALNNDSPQLALSINKNSQFSEYFLAKNARLQPWGSEHSTETYYLGEFVEILSSHRIFEDPASAFPVAALAVQPGETVLDMCAAPGGKSLLIGSLLKLSGEAERPFLVANESSRARMDRLQKTLRTFFPSNGGFQVVNCDPVKSSKPLGRFAPYDAILVDAPCSSDRHALQSKTLHTQWKPSTPKKYQVTQLKLLIEAFNFLRPQGRLVYCTCALSSLENDVVIEKFLRKGHNAVVENCDLSLVNLPGTRIISGEVSDPQDEYSKTETSPNSETGFGISRTSYGYQILPDSCQGSGPIYLSLLRKEAA